MAGQHSSNKRPVYYKDEEAKVFENTPKHVLYALMRDYALQIMGETNVDEMLKDMPERIEILKQNRLIK